MVRRTYGIAQRQGKLLPVPDVLKQYPNIDTIFVSPLDQAQNAAEARNMVAALNTVLQIAQAQPDALDNIDWDYGIRQVVKKMGVPPPLLQDPRRVQQIRQVREEAKRQQIEIENAAKAAQAAGQMAPALEMIQGGAGGE